MNEHKNNKRVGTLFSIEAHEYQSIFNNKPNEIDFS